MYLPNKWYLLIVIILYRGFLISALRFIFEPGNWFWTKHSCLITLICTTETNIYALNTFNLFQNWTYCEHKYWPTQRILYISEMGHISDLNIYLLTGILPDIVCMQCKKEVYFRPIYSLYIQYFLDLLWLYFACFFVRLGLKSQRASILTILSFLESSLSNINFSELNSM